MIEKRRTHIVSLQAHRTYWEDISDVRLLFLAFSVPVNSVNFNIILAINL